MQRQKSKIIALGANTASYTLLLKSVTSSYTFTGTVSLGVSQAVITSGTVKEGMHCLMWFNTAITVGAYTFTILGVAINKEILKSPFLVSAIYTGGAWCVACEPFTAFRPDGTTITSTGGIFSVTSVGNTQWNSSDKLAYSNMTLTGAILNTDLHATFAMPVAQLADLTASEIVITGAGKKLESAAVATYPSLAQLAFLKGVTSAVQTQLNTLTSTFSGYVTTGALASALTSYYTSSQTDSAIAAAMATFTTVWDGTTIAATTDLNLLTSWYQEYLLDPTGGAIDLGLPAKSKFATGEWMKFTLVNSATPSTITPNGAETITDFTGALLSPITLSAIGDYVKIAKNAGTWYVVETNL